MPPRRVSVDPRAVVEPATECPYCGTTLPSDQPAHLRFVPHQLFRCPRGQHPRVALLRCGGCRRTLAVYEAGGRLGSGGHLALMLDQAGTLSAIRNRDRNDLAADFYAGLERN